MPRRRRRSLRKYRGPGGETWSGRGLAGGDGSEGQEARELSDQEVAWVGAHFAAFLEGGARFFVSGMSAKARGLGDADLVGKAAEFAMPDVLIDRATAADVVLCY